GQDGAAAFGGLYNRDDASFEVNPDEVLALTFSDLMPNLELYYDDHHSVVTQSAGIYELEYQLRAESLECGKLRIAITNDGRIVPSSLIAQPIACRDPFTIAGKAITEAEAGAHLHFVLFSSEHAKFKLQDGVNAYLVVKKLADLPQE
ncbi:MAG: hypothetical protein LBT14_10820, partial [Treponema sp.]|nr:hypothetical protein [Treponema sp.]